MRTLHQRTIDVAAVRVVAASAERVGVVRPTPTKPSEVVDAAAPRHVLDFEIPLETTLTLTLTQPTSCLVRLVG